MREARRDERLVAESLGRLRAGDHVVANHLDRDLPVERIVTRLVDRAHPAAPKPPVDRIAPAEQARNARPDQRGPILRTPGRGDSVTGAALRTLAEGVGGAAFVQSPVQQHGKARGNRSHQLAIVAVVRLFGALGAEHEHRFALIGSRGDDWRHQIELRSCGWQRLHADRSSTNRSGKLEQSIGFPSTRTKPTSLLSRVNFGATNESGVTART